MSRGGGAKEVPGVLPPDHPIGWSQDSRSVIVQRNPDVPTRIDRVDPSTSRRTPVSEISPTGVGPITMLDVTDWKEGERWYVYNYTLLPSTLFVVARTID